MGNRVSRLYILTRLDLSPSQRAVQSCHALTRLMTRHGTDPSLLEWANDHQTLIILGVSSESQLRRFEDELCTRGVICEHFREPEMGNQLTAVAVHPSADPRLFRELPLV